MIAKIRGYLIAISICLTVSPLLAAGAGLGGVARAGAQEPTHEYRTKAAFIYNFPRFTRWPAGRFSDSEAERLTGILAALTDRPVLTVGGMPDFPRAGGNINLQTSEEDKLRFEINTGIAKQSGLKFSSKLFSLAGITGD